MPNYAKIVDYAAKDLLLLGDPAKAGKGTEIDAEFNAIAAMSATKAELAGSASQAFSVAAGTGTQAIQATQLAASSGASLVGFVHSGAGAVPRTLQARGRDTVAVEDFIVVAEANQTQAFIRAATYLLSQSYPGGTITVNSRVTVTAGLIDFWNILAAAQGITPASGYLPNGQLVRGTQINLIGQGVDRSSVIVTGAGVGFTWGNFTTISDKRAMTGVVEGIDFVGPGAIGHTAQVVIAGAQGFTTTTNGSAGTTNTTTTCLSFRESVPGTVVAKCRFRYFQGAVTQRYGFGFVARDNVVQYCNIGFEFGAGVTTWLIDGGNEIEVCAVGVYSTQTSNGRIGPCVIEANLAGCDVLIHVSKYLTMEGTWNGEGSPKNVIIRGDQAAPSLPNLGLSFNRLVGLKIDNNGGLYGMRVRHCAIDQTQAFSVNTGERWGDNAFEYCTYNEGPVDLSGFTYSGIATPAGVKILGPTTGGLVASYASRLPLEQRKVVSTASVAAVDSVSLTVPNVTTTARLVILITKIDRSGGGYQTQTVRYVGIVVRTLNAVSDFYMSSNETVGNNYAASGATANTLVSPPGITVTGANTATQTLTLRIATGTPASGTCETFIDSTLFLEKDGITFS